MTWNEAWIVSKFKLNAFSYKGNVNIISKCICKFSHFTPKWILVFQELFHLSAYVSLSGHCWHTANVIKFMEEISIYLQAKATEYEIADFRIIGGVLHAIANCLNADLYLFDLSSTHLKVLLLLNWPYLNRLHSKMHEAKKTLYLLYKQKLFQINFISRKLSSIVNLRNYYLF